MLSISFEKFFPSSTVEPSSCGSLYFMHIICLTARQRESTTPRTLCILRNNKRSIHLIFIYVLKATWPRAIVKDCPLRRRCVLYSLEYLFAQIVENVEVFYDLSLEPSGPEEQEITDNTRGWPTRILPKGPAC